MERGLKKGQNRVVSFRERESGNYKKQKTRSHEKKKEEEKDERP
jgi:hypothetical protein